MLAVVRYLWPLPGIVMSPMMVGFGIYLIVHGKTALGVWVLSLGAIVLGTLVWALFRPGGWWQPRPGDREYWEDPDRWQDSDSD